jgi:hypothetical protein
MTDTITQKIIYLIESRARKGFETYGVTMDRDDLTQEQWIHHAIEEALDLAIYLMKIKTSINENSTQHKRVHPFVSTAKVGPLEAK